MNKFFIKPAILLCSMILLTSCGTGSKDSTNSGIDVAEAFNNLSDLKVSDIAQRIRYIPLETTDESLIGRKPSIKVFKDKIIISADNECFLFDKETGKFYGKVGHKGEDPEGYSSSNCWVDESTDILYFPRNPNQLIKYDLNGNFLGKIELTDKFDIPGWYEFSDTKIIGYNNNVMLKNLCSLNFYDKNGLKSDSIISSFQDKEYSVSDIEAISVMSNIETYGRLALSGIIYLSYKNGMKNVVAPNSPVLWKVNGEIRFNELFVDTIYTVKENSIEPYLYFNLGHYTFPKEERMSEDNNEKRLVVSSIIENNDYLLFQCIKGIYTDPVTYNGIYNKNTKSTTMSLAKNNFKDNINNFLDINPWNCSDKGEFVSLLSTEKIMEWLDDNPTGDMDGNLKFLSEYNDDMNPVVVILQ